MPGSRIRPASAAVGDTRRTPPRKRTTGRILEASAGSQRRRQAVFDHDSPQHIAPTRAKWIARSSKYTIPLQGGAAKYQNGGPPEGVSDIFTIVDANTMYLTRLQNGKQVIALRSVISKDGKTMQNTTRGIDADGKPFERVTVFDRQ